jgi:hypothetical protein
VPDSVARFCKASEANDSPGSRRVVLGDCRVGPLRMSDAMVLELDEQGQIPRIRPPPRPWLAVTAFALILGPKVIRRPGTVWRALRS